jgi:2-(1,2-epoxy-1,2-dihydrophenyl)acetyl-CoA isomerase
MSMQPDYNVDTSLFSAHRWDETILVHPKRSIFFIAQGMPVRDEFFKFLERIEADDSIKVIALGSMPQGMGKSDYLEYFDKRKPKRTADLFAARFCNTFDRVIMPIVQTGKIVVAAANGELIMDFLGVLLACDYRVLAEDTVFVNAHLDLGLVPQGGVTFFLNELLGRKTARQLLLTESSLEANELLRLGLVDELVPEEDLEVAVMRAARRFDQIPLTTLTGVKRMANHSLGCLRSYLDHEDRIFNSALHGNSGPSMYDPNLRTGT